MVKETSKCFLDTNFVIDVWSAEIVDEFKSYVHMHNLHIIIPGEVYRELVRIDVPEFLSRMSLDKDKTLVEFPPLLEKDRIKGKVRRYKFGAGEEHIAVMARWFKSRGQKVLALTSDKSAQKLLYRHKIDNIGIYDVMIILNHSGFLPKDQAIVAISLLEKSKNTMHKKEKEAVISQMR